VGGWGDGGLLGLYAAALDTRIDGALVSGYFGSRQQLWEEPIDRNVFGLLDQFGDAELAALVAPRGLVVEAAKGPEVVLPGQGGAPARLVTPAFTEVRAEVARGEAMVAGLRPRQQWRVTGATHGQPAAPYSSATLNVWLEELGVVPDPALIGELPTPVGPVPDATSRRLRQVREIDQHTQRQLTESPYVRGEFMRDLDTFSLERYVASSEPYRARFAEDTIGRFDQPLLAPNARSRLAYDTPAFRGYEVTLEVFPDLFAYGILLLPRDLGPGERRPVVVCQHGLEGRPQDVISGEVPAYRDFAARLAERGFITFAPQNLYIFGDRFRTLQRKANPLGKSLFSLIVPQHQQIVNWLKSLPCVDPGRIAFYGLSYGGKTAMRVPALVTDYCLSICSADFNEWVWKNASTRSPYSYVFTGEYEIFEWDLGSTFNYAEMAALIAPRPFMVERGHFDGVAPDETVAYEFARVRHLYQARLGIGDRCEIEWFVGPHTINGQGTFDFLHRHLRWPVSRKQAGKR
jgi:cephalosporin-C deacetylase-like acetyl esterase